MSMNVNGSTQKTGTEWFQKMADGAGVKEMISGEFKRLASKAGSRQTAFTEVNC